MFKKPLSLPIFLALSLLISGCQNTELNLASAKKLLEEIPADVDTTTDIKAILLPSMEVKDYQQCISKSDGVTTRYFKYRAMFSSANTFFEEITEHWDDQCTSPMNNATHYLQYAILEMKRVDANNNYNMKLQVSWLGNDIIGTVYGQPYDERMAFLAGSSSEVFPTMSAIFDRPISIASDFNLVSYLQGSTTIPLPHYVYVAPPPDLLVYLDGRTQVLEIFTLCETIVQSGVTKYFYHSFHVSAVGRGYYGSLQSTEMMESACENPVGPSLSQTFGTSSATALDQNYLDYDLATTINSITDENGAELKGLAYNSTMEFLSGSTGTFLSGHQTISITMGGDWRSITLPLGSRNITLSLPAQITRGR